MSNLYKKYFPIKSERERDDFIQKNGSQIYRILDSLSMSLSYNAMDRIKMYDRRMKRTISLLGNIKIGNVLHNRAVVNEKKNDRWLKGIEKQARIIEELRYKHTNFTLTIEDVNGILELENNERKYILRQIIIVVSVSAVLGTIWFLN